LQFEQRCFEAPAFRQCTACSPCVVRSYRQSADDRWQFLRRAFADGSSLEELTGLSALHAGAEDAHWDDAEDSDADELDA
jgi:hypothetical protein